MKRIKIDPITRLEGHGKIHIFQPIDQPGKIGGVFDGRATPFTGVEIEGEGGVRTGAVKTVFVNDVHGLLAELVMELDALRGGVERIFGKICRHPDTAVWRHAAAGIEQHLTGTAVLHLESGGG